MVTYALRDNASAVVGSMSDPTLKKAILLRAKTTDN
jgi:hypothetical protein